MKTILVDAVFCFVSFESEINTEMHELLESFPNRKIILTNADYEETNKFGLNDMPYEVFTLKFNPEKTDPSYYEKMLAHFNLDASDVIYFEHNAEAIASAEVAGITTHHYDKDKKDLAALKKFINENL